MANVLIERDTMTAIADALRAHHGETKTVTNIGEPTMKISKTPNVTDLDNYTIGYGESKKIWDRVTIPGAVKIQVNLYYWTEDVDYDFIVVASGSYADYTYPPFDYKFGGSVKGTWGNTTLEFEYCDTVTFYFYSDSSGSEYPGYYAEVTGIDADGNPVAEVTTEELQNTYKPAEMPGAINDILIPTGELNITKDGTYDVTKYASAVVSTGAAGGAVAMPEIILNAMNSSTTMQTGTAVTFDVTNYTSMRILYEIKNPGVTNNKSEFSLFADMGYKAALNTDDGTYRWTSREQVDDNPRTETILNNTMSASGEWNFDVTNYTSLLLRLGSRKYSTNAYGSLRIYGIILW